MIVERTENNIYIKAEEGHILIQGEDEPFECAYLPLDIDLSTIQEIEINYDIDSID